MLIKNYLFHLAPVQKEDGFWVIGLRLSSSNPMEMTAGLTLQKLLPYKHPVTRFLMQRAHFSDHRGPDVMQLWRDSVNSIG